MKSFNPRMLLPLLLLPLGSPAPAADAVTEQIDAGRQAYEAGDPRGAIQALNFAVAQIEEQLKALQLQVLPAPLPGWTAEDAQSETAGFAAMIAGTNLSRTYRRDDGEASLTITITADSPMLAMMNMMMSTPLLMQADPDNAPFTFGGYRGTIQQPPDGSAKVMLMVGSRILVQLEGRGTDRQTLEAYLEALNLSGLEKALLG
ncbi:hypothetical protein F2Q65_08145 [Thiohalocapsa marina]|uniref:Uncharacterized protein n=1 Tax=Thiohalocapsa marina TaxID=424902 RepID=A0A5M8FPP3_9GAMM|nr:hypothetical protein [Thiohalocapsa marina]KAA6185656.1 hypothetical protein F2Q65_08145 [Thiohalocapsa marina]